MSIQSKISINLESLLDLSARLNQTYDELFILNATLLSLMGKLKVVRACVLTPDINKKNFTVGLSKGKREFDSIPYFDIKSLQEINPTNGCEKILGNCGYKYCIPVMYQFELLAVICLGNKIDNSELLDEEYHYANIVSSISANAIQNAKNHQSLIKAKNHLEHRNQLLTTLFEMSRDFSALLSKNHILRMLSYHLMGQLMVSRFAVFLYSNDSELIPIVNRFDKIPDYQALQPLTKLNETSSIEEITANGKLERFFIEAQVKVISPMIVAGSPKGLLIVGRKMNGDEFTEENIQFIKALGNTAILALENERLFLEELEKKRLDNEMHLALEIQKNLLPKKIPNIPNFHLHGESFPSRLVGGDYFDFINLSENRLLIAIADVSGKGMPAALLMANVQAALRVLSPLELPLKELVQRINNIVFHNTSPDKFVTFFCGILDYSERTFHYLNAGHNPPFLLRTSGEIDLLTQGGLILGIFEEPFNYSEGIVTLSMNDVLLFYTDGITEAHNIHNEEYGEERLKSLLKLNVHRSALDIMDEIIDSVNYYSDGMPQHDDLTLIVLKAIKP